MRTKIQDGIISVEYQRKKYFLASMMRQTNKREEKECIFSK